MSLLCPNCEKTNKCDCKTCNPDGNATDLIIILEQEQLYQCCFCSHKFNEQDSLDFEWDRMLEDFSKRATPELCLEWLSITGKERKLLEKRINVGQFGFEQSFRIHFKMNYKDITKDIFKQLSIQLERDLKINKLINEL
jgi:hypothetical protein